MKTKQQFKTKAFLKHTQKKQTISVFKTFGSKKKSPHKQRCRASRFIFSFAAKISAKSEIRKAQLKERKKERKSIIKINFCKQTKLYPCPALAKTTFPLSGEKNSSSSLSGASSPALSFHSKEQTTLTDVRTLQRC